jgi:hypothetical protein
MKSHIIALAALAAIGFSGAAFAEDATPGAGSAKATPVTAPTVMSDSEMDKVTAGVGQGNYTAWHDTTGPGGINAQHGEIGLVRTDALPSNSVNPGYGRDTAACAHLGVCP